MYIPISPRTANQAEYVCDTKAMIVYISNGMLRTQQAGKHSDSDAILLSARRARFPFAALRRVLRVWVQRCSEDP